MLDGDERDVVGPDEEVHFGLNHGAAIGRPNGIGPGMIRVGVGSVFLNGSDGDASGEGEGVVVAPARAAPLILGGGMFLRAKRKM